MDKIIQVAIIGFGSSGQNFHAPFIASHPGFNLSMVVERTTERAKQFYPHVKIVRHVQQVFESETIDLVVIATPNDSHFELAKQALEAGKNVIVDKPFVPTYKEGLELIALAKKQDKMLTVFQNRRWDGGFLTVKEILSKKLLGTVVEYEARFDRFRNQVNPMAWKEKQTPGSGILYDLGSHLIDQALVLFGQPSEVSADIRCQRPGALVDDYFELNLMYSQLKVILKAGVLVREPTPIFSIYGMQGAYVKYGLDTQEACLKAGGIPTDSDFGVEDKKFWGRLNTELNGIHSEGLLETLPGHYLSFYENIYESLISKQDPAVKAEEALAVIKIIELARLSHAEKRTVSYLP
jgi:scyllo-inositol 2-dehydrogenase (NADP+)